MRSDHFEMFRCREGFVGIRRTSVTEEGTGQTCAREPFTIDPTLAGYESNRFADFVPLLKTRLYPLGEASGGNYFLAIGENDNVYLLMEDFKLLGKSMDEALEALSIGRQPMTSG